MNRLTRARDRFDTEIDVQPLLGTWINFDRAAVGIVRAELTRSRDGVLHLAATTAPDQARWDAVPVTVFSDDVARRRAAALLASFTLAHQSVAIAGYVARGLLTLEAATTFTDGSGRSQHYVRQHFYRIPT